jgi:hypothetical protein
LKSSATYLRTDCLTAPCDADPPRRSIAKAGPPAIDFRFPISGFDIDLILPSRQAGDDEARESGFFVSVSFCVNAAY